jgi:sodium-dependent phosphate cotransporter
MKKSVNRVDDNRDGILKNWLKLLLFLYLFVLSIGMIKKASGVFAPSIRDYLFGNVGPLKAVSLGWFSTAIAQSSGAVSSVVITFTGNSIVDLPTAIYILVGASLGTTITALIISLVTVSSKRKDFRHGFEIGLCYAIYSAILIFVVLVLEYFFGLFSMVSLFLAEGLQGRVRYLQIPDLIGIITDPLVGPLFERFNSLLLFLGSFVVLIFTLRFIGGSVVDVFGGEDESRRFINRHFDSKIKAYFLGVVLTAIVFSSSITIGLLVPLAVARLIGLRRSIPFILGADLGTFSDTLLVALIVGKTSAIAAALAYALFAIAGALIFLPNTDWLYKMTKYVSKRLIHISRKKAFYLLILFLLLPLGVVLIF